jgi:hypothetical protein
VCGLLFGASSINDSEYYSRPHTRQNPKFEARNTKQAPNPKRQKSETPEFQALFLLF